MLKTNGSVYNDITKKEFHVPTWHFKSDPNQYMVKGDNARK